MFQNTKHLCKLHTVVYLLRYRVLQHYKSSYRTFQNWYTNTRTNACFLQGLPFCTLGGSAVVVEVAAVAPASIPTAFAAISIVLFFLGSFIFCPFSFAQQFRVKIPRWMKFSTTCFVQDRFGLGWSQCLVVYQYAVYQCFACGIFFSKLLQQQRHRLNSTNSTCLCLCPWIDRHSVCFQFDVFDMPNDVV